MNMVKRIRRTPKVKMGLVKAKYVALSIFGELPGSPCHGHPTTKHTSIKKPPNAAGAFPQYGDFLYLSTLG